MLYWPVVFLIVAIIAAVFGFGGIAAGATTWYIIGGIGASILGLLMVVLTGRTKSA